MEQTALLFSFSNFHIYSLLFSFIQNGTWHVAKVPLSKTMQACLYSWYLLDW